MSNLAIMEFKPIHTIYSRPKGTLKKIVNLRQMNGSQGTVSDRGHSFVYLLSFRANTTYQREM
jgi:hypothetical protein